MSVIKDNSDEHDGVNPGSGIPVREDVGDEEPEESILDEIARGKGKRPKVADPREILKYM